MKKLFLFLVFCLLYSYSLLCQHTPLKNDEALKKAYLAEIEAKYKGAVQALKDNGSKYKKELKQMYKIRWMANYNRAQQGHYIFDYKWQNYFDALKEEIGRKNLSYDLSTIQVVLGRYDSPNAFSVGDGTIVVNIGLIPHLKNEDQLVFILCHEFSHYLLEHNEKQMKAAIEKSPELRSKLDKIIEGEYYQATKLKQLVKENLYFERQHSRLMELESDSLGFELYQNTRYNPAQAPETMALLDSLTDYIGGVDIDIFEYLKTKKVKLEVGSFIDPPEENDGDLDDDSILTHPEALKRQAALQRMLQKKGLSTDIKSTEAGDFGKFQTAMRYEYAESLIAFSQYDKAFLYCIRQLQKEPDSEYLKSTGAYCFYRLYEARKNHRTGRCASPPHDTPDSSYARLTQYIYASRIAVMAVDAYTFCKNAVDDETKDERLVFCMAMLAKANQDMATFEKYRTRYIKLYPKGNYITQIPRT